MSTLATSSALRCCIPRQSSSAQPQNATDLAPGFAYLLAIWTNNFRNGWPFALEAPLAVGLV